MQIREVQTPVPDNLRQRCAREPQRPAHALTEAEAADLVAQAIVAGRDCRSTADGLQDLLAPK